MSENLTVREHLYAAGKHIIKASSMLRHEARGEQDIATIVLENIATIIANIESRLRP